MRLRDIFIEATTPVRPTTLPTLVERPAPRLKNWWEVGILDLANFYLKSIIALAILAAVLFVLGSLVSLLIVGHILKP